MLAHKSRILWRQFTDCGPNVENKVIEHLRILHFFISVNYTSAKRSAHLVVAVSKPHSKIQEK